MDPKRWHEIDDLLQSALAQALSERQGFIAAATAGDDALRHEVQSLLCAYDAPGVLDLSISNLASDLPHAAEAESLQGSILGPYRLLDRLGVGATAQVYRAEDSRLSRVIALKVLPPSATARRSRVERFAQEARSASALNHPNIVTVYDVGCVDGRHYIATELVPGQTLRERLGERIDPSEAMRIAAQIADALQAAHTVGIAHRDIKPENVMLRSDGVVKLVDFGLAKLITPESIASGVRETLPGVLLGTAPYMSPEQAAGVDVDCRTDIFSLGAVLFEMIEGRPPFAGTTVGSVIASILRDEPPPLSARHSSRLAGLNRIIRRALCKDREQRYQRAGELLADLRMLENESPRVRPRPKAYAAASLVITMVVAVASINYLAVARPGAVDHTEADQLYLKGRFFWNKRTIPALETAIKYFRQATAVAPEYARAYAGLADTYLALSGNNGAPGSPREYVAQAKQAALTALRLDDANVEARVTLAAIKHSSDWDWVGAEHDFKRALTLDPTYAPAHHRYGVFLAFMRRFDESLAALRRAERLDPVSLAISTDIGLTYLFARQADRAIEQLETSLEIDNSYWRARFDLAEAYGLKGMYQHAATVIDDGPPGSRASPAGEVARYRTMMLAGRQRNTQQLLDRLLEFDKREHVPPTSIAELYAMLGNHDEAFRWFEKAYEARSMAFLRVFVDPRWETYSIYSDPRFAELKRRTGLSRERRSVQSP